MRESFTFPHDDVLLLIGDAESPGRRRLRAELLRSGSLGSEFDNKFRCVSTTPAAVGHRAIDERSGTA